MDSFDDGIILTPSQLLSSDVSMDTLGVQLCNTFSIARGSFNVCHINAQSIPSHYNDLLDSFTDSAVHAILVSETWLKPSLSSIQYSLPGYILIRNDRSDKRGGGVAIYLRSYIPYKIIAISPSAYTASPEYIFLSLEFSGVKVVLGVVYCPPTIDFHHKFESILDHVMPLSRHHIIMGDFNTCLLKSTLKSIQFRQLVKSFNLNVLPTQATHHSSESDSWLDLMMTSIPDNIISHGQLLAPGFSHHDLVYAAYRLKPPKPKPKIIYRRNLHKMDKQALHNDAAAIDWNPVLEAETIDQKVHNFNNILLSLYNTHAPVHPIKIKKPNAPWITQGVRMAMRRRDRAFRKFKKDRCEEIWNIYKRARNCCNKLCRNAKRQYFSDRLTSCKSSAAVWSFLKSIGLGKVNKDLVGTSLTADDINIHFCNTLTLDESTRNNTIDDISRMPISSTPVFFFSLIDESEVSKTIKSLTSKAVGCDGIGRDMVVEVLQFILSPLVHIINFSLSSGQFPSFWRNAIVIPLPKNPSPALPSDIRPISILPFLSKVIEAIAHKQLFGHISSHCLLSPFQSGFRPGHSTTTALMKVTEDIRAGMENNLVTLLVLVDFSNAFNNVDPHILLSILLQQNFSSSAVNWLRSYLLDRQQAVCLNDIQSPWRGLKAGVPQGGILSPLLFSMFIDLATPCFNCSFHLYADDLQLYTVSNIDDMHSAVSTINSNLASLAKWSAKFGIEVNPNKCQAIIIGGPRLIQRIDTSSLPSIVYNTFPIPYSSCVKDLGLFIDSRLNWSTHIAEVHRKVHATLHSLYQVKNFLPSRIKLSLVQSLLIPLIDYADSCYLDLNKDLANKLERLQNCCIRFIFDLRKYDHISQFRQQLKWLPISKRRNLRLLCLLYSVLFDRKYPSYLKCMFSFLSSANKLCLRSSHNLVLSFPSHHSGYLSSSFSVEAVRLWNKLPLKIRQAPNRMIFKKMIFKHYLVCD